MPSELAIFLIVGLAMLTIAVVGLIWSMRNLATRAEVRAMEIDFERKFLEERRAFNETNRAVSAQMLSMNTTLSEMKAGMDVLLTDRKINNSKNIQT